MKNKLLTCFLCMLSAFSLLTVCGQQEEPDSLSAASSGAVTEASPEYNGTCISCVMDII